MLALPGTERLYQRATALWIFERGDDQAIRSLQRLYAARLSTWQRSTPNLSNEPLCPISPIAIQSVRQRHKRNFRYPNRKRSSRLSQCSRRFYLSGRRVQIDRRIAGIEAEAMGFPAVS